MAAIVYQTNKKTGVVYAYESVSYWDKEKQQSRAKRKCIGRVNEEARQHFFQLQGKRRVEKEYLAYDSISISSYSKYLRQVRWGKNKDHDHLPQINLSLLFGQQSRLPFYYRKLAGNIPAVKTLRKARHEQPGI